MTRTFAILMFYKKQSLINKSVSILKNELSEFKDDIEIEKVVYNKENGRKITRISV